MKQIKKKNTLSDFLLGNKALVIVAIVAVLLSFATDKFFTTKNLLSVLRQVCVSSILAFGFTMILAEGEIDLSVGSILGLSGMVLGLLTTKLGMNVWLAMLLSLLCGALLGALNASIITTFSLPPFIVTMATDQIFRGICYLSTNMRPIVGLPDVIQKIGQGYFLKIPIPIYIMLFMMALVYIIANYTKLGRYIIACGGNRDAAFVSGINVKRIRMYTFMLLGVCAAVAGIVLTGRTASSQVSAGDGMSMDAIAACVIGGTSMNGGTAFIINTLFGCVLIGMLNNGLNLLGVDSNWQIIAKGAIVLIAVILDRLSSRVAKKK